MFFLERFYMQMFKDAMNRVLEARADCLKISKAAAI
jgi:hypothetical protein